MISVIIPIYNCEKYLNECIDSILNQSYKKIEIILVDDGSTDRSREICLSYSSKFSYIKYIRKDNGGVSSSRNIGIENSQGKYVMFIDSDDVLLNSNIFEECIITIENRSKIILPIFNCKFICEGKDDIGKAFNVTSNQNKIEYISALISGVYNSNNYYGELFKAVWGKLFIADIIKTNNIKFNEQIYIGEDSLFLMEYIKYIDSIEEVENILYGYRIHNNSACNRYKVDLINQSYLYKEEMFKILKVHNLNEELISTSIIQFIFKIYNNLIKNEVKNNRINKKNLQEWLTTNKTLILNRNIKKNLLLKRVRLQLFIYKYFRFSLSTFSIFVAKIFFSSN